MVRRITPAVSIIVLALAALVGLAIGAMIGVGQGPDVAATPRAVATDIDTPSATPTPTSPQITLTADPKSVQRNEDIRLTGAISSGEGDVRLQVERSINGGEWDEFPVSTTSKSDGSFSVRVNTGRTGTVEFRVSGEIDGASVQSEAAAVEIG